MGRKIKSFLISALSIGLVTSLGFSSLTVHAAPDSPGGSDKPGNSGGPGGSGMPGGSNGAGSPPSYSGATEISSDTTVSGEKYISSTGAENALLFSGGTSTFTNFSVVKTGDTSDENSDFYGTNAAILVYNDAVANITGGTVETNGGHANAVFAYGTGEINITDTTIKTNANNSGGIMVTGGGTLNAKNLTVETQGNSSAAIRSDRGGGTEVVDGGTYTTNGIGSPAVYSTANVSVANATLNSIVSEGAVIEGFNTISLNNVVVNNSNTKLNGNSETYKNIFIYQSMSGDAEEGTGAFSAKNSTLNESHGDNFFVTNTSAKIALENNRFNNTSDEFVFLKAASGKWGNSGSNGGNVTLTATNQNLKGDFMIDNVSTLMLELKQGSYLLGAIDSAQTAKQTEVSIDESSIWVLTADSYINVLTDTVPTAKNIYGNGHTLYVDGVAVETNTETPPAMDESDDGADLDTTAVIEPAEAETNTTLSEPDGVDEKGDDALWWALGGVVGGIVIAVIIVALLTRRKPVETSRIRTGSPEIELPQFPKDHQK